MKRIVVTCFAVMLVACAFGQEVASNFKPGNPLNSNGAIFTWTETLHDFGKIKVGVPVSFEFTFQNTGDIPLIITSVQASCGCTVASYSKDPIEPNGKGFVKATYNAAAVGQFTKTVTVNANTDDGAVILTFKGEVIQNMNP